MAREMVRTLCIRKSNAFVLGWLLFWGQWSRLTSWHDNPDEIHEEVIEPEVVSLWPAVDQSEKVFIESIGGIVENIPVDLTEGDDQLQGLTKRMFNGDQVGDNERKRTPAHLESALSQMK